MFVITLAQVEVEGLRAPPLSLLVPGAALRWTGAATRLGPAGGGLLRLSGPLGGDLARARAARAVRRLLGEAAMRPEPEPVVPETGEEGDLTLSDGRRAWTARVIAREPGGAILVFPAPLPPADTDLWIVRAPLPRRAVADGGAVICFTPGTMIRGEGGPRPVEDLRPGDRVQTRDDGMQEVLWTARTRLSGARLRVTPALRPVRLRAGALGIGRPERELVVSPGHRMLVRGAAAQALFNAPEVLVEARDLVDGRAIAVDHVLREVTYVHVLFARHQIVWANGLETESFHPGTAALDSLDPASRAALRDVLPGVAEDAAGYGETARRSLTAAEAAILRHDIAA